MRPAITTKYLSPTDTRGARIVAKAGTGERVIIPYPYALSGADVHREAAAALCERMGWQEKDLCGGYTVEGYVFVFVAKR